MDKTVRLYQVFTHDLSMIYRGSTRRCQVLVTGFLSKSTNPSVSIFPVEINISGTTQLKTPQTCCKLSIYRPVTICQQVATNLSILSSCNKLRLLKSGLLQLVIFKLVETTCSQPVDNKFCQSTCDRSVDNLQQTCRRQAVASHENASCYWLVVTSL